ncbi:Pathogenesis-related protein PRB1-3 [Psilocybe cubensis]|uniref:Pathogenesis-related protein PRB1-3 n=1 Tax=Psilocybe cubensis TaxID=181762 RepID=A0ACB8HES8_PSICU|nr:Pathogenesis-related protein PRB1-3 [Psilocybe cubensis]KAH9485645.1 Pathogenesis-related protein PRB1-3 [Psilocybe cubensis]
MAKCIKISTFFALIALITSVSALPSSQSVDVEPAELIKSRAADDSWMNSVISSHNTNRAAYGASAVTWNANLYPGALSWAQACKFQHSGGNYGENLYAASGSSNIMADGMKAWMSEASKYDYNNPGFSSATGHFTQVVWKATTQVACASANCPAGTIFPTLPATYLVCRYSPPGNVMGQFRQNVGRHV